MSEQLVRRDRQFAERHADATDHTADALAIPPMRWLRLVFGSRVSMR